MTSQSKYVEKNEVHRMTDETTKLIQGSESRAQVIKDLNVAVLIEQNSDDGGDTNQGDVIDLSRHGAKLSVGQTIQIQNAITVRLQLPELNLDYAIPAVVCWTRPKGAGELGELCR